MVPPFAADAAKTGRVKGAAAYRAEGRNRRGLGIGVQRRFQGLPHRASSFLRNGQEDDTTHYV